MLDLLTALIKVITYGAVLVSAGGVLAHQTIRPPWSARAMPLRQIAGALLVAATAVCACLYAVRLGTADIELLQIVFISPVGLALLMSLIAGGGVLVSRSVAGDIVSAALGLGAFGVVGHAPALNVLAAATVVVHLAAAAWWIGGMLLLLRAEKKLAPGPFALTVSRFSSQAIWIVAALLIAGSATVAQLLKFSIDWGEAYDRGLMIKLLLVCVLLIVAAINKQILTPRLSEDGRTSLQLMIKVELALALAILVVTATVTTVFPPP